MLNLRPFRALRYNQDIAGPISELVAPPYDIIYDGWRERLYQRNPHNIIRLIKTKGEPGDTESNNKYTRANDYIRTWIDKGVLRLEDKPSIYLRSDTYNLNGETKTRYGFISLLQVEEFGSSIHPHERTLSGPKADRMNLVKATQTNLSQIFSIYEDQDGTLHNSIVKKTTETTPDIDFKDEQGIERRMWVVSDPDFIQNIFRSMENRDIIIADGHHRYETALTYKAMKEKDRTQPEEPFDYVTMYFSSSDAPGMSILPTHRKVMDTDSFNENAFFEELEKHYEIKPEKTTDIQEMLDSIKNDSEKTNIFGFYTSGGFRVARLKNPAVPKELDVEILHNDIIEKQLGISKEDIASGKFLHFAKSPEHCIEDVDSGSNQMGIFLNAIRSEELFRRVLKGDRMPQKSTYFFPKTLSGLVMYKIDRNSF